MAIKKVVSGWQVDIRPEGRSGVRIRRTFPTKRQADQFFVEQKAKAYAGEWTPPIKDKRRLLSLLNDWFNLHGYTLKDGERRKQTLEKTIIRLGNPIAKSFTSQDWLIYRKTRLEEGRSQTYVNDATKEKAPLTANTVNHEHAYLSALFGTLVKLGNWAYKNPLRGIPKLKIDETDLFYLEIRQVGALLSALKYSRNQDVLLITKLCLATGARWGEASSLEGQQIRNGLVTYIKTKNSLSRSIPISKELEKELLNVAPRVGPLFKGNSHKAFANGLVNAGINLPKGQKTHVLRRTFASHFMINNGNIFKLQKILGHSTLAMTLRYARFAPDHLCQVLEKNVLFLTECQHKRRKVTFNDFFDK